MARGLAYRNRAPEQEGLPPDKAPPEYVKREFAAKLAAFMLKKGWNQSELARQASKHLSDGELSRDNVSNYYRGKHLPNESRLLAIAKALGIDPEELLPPGAAPSASDQAPKFDMKDLGDGMVYLRVNDRYPWDKVLKVMQILKGD